MRTLISVLLVCFLQTASASTYYFSSSSGDDSRTSTQGKNSSTPWKTISKLNSFFTNLQPGDAVLFKRGETFYGSITVNKSGTASAPIVIGAYGTGNKPVITSLVTLSGWTANSTYKGVYDCSANSSLGSQVNIVLLNDVQKGIGRYPNPGADNKGYLILESHSGSSSITDKQLTSTPNWKGAEMVIRSSHWVLDRHLITNHSGSTLYYSGSYAPRDNYGYFIQNSIKTLDQLGEWYYNPSTKKVSMYFGSNSPSSYSVKAAASNNVIYSSSKSYVVFDNLTVKGANENGFDLNSGSNIIVQNCDILFSGKDGVSLSDHSNFKLENCTVLNSNNNGVAVSGSNKYAIVRNNIVKNTHTIPGMGQSGQGQGAGIRISNSGLVEYNHIINSGFLGINMAGNYTVVKNNYIDTFCFVKDDGAGIYMTNGDNVTNTGRKITGNIVLNGIGAPNGTNTTNSSADGIYMDDDVNGVEIAGNTIANANRGLYLHNTRSIVVKNNTSYNNNNGQLHMKYDGLGGLLRNHTITNNLFISKLNTQFTSSLNSKANDLGSIGQFDYNYYARPIDDRTVITNAIYIYTSSQDIDNHNLEGWKAEYGKDINSKKSAKQIAAYKLKSLVGSNKSPYGAFSSSSDMDKLYGRNSCSVYWGNSGVLDGGYLKIVPSSKTSSITMGVGTLTYGKKYILKYSLKGSGSMSIGAFLRSSYSSNYAAITKTQYRTVNTTRTENDMIFTPSQNETSGALVFKVDAQSTYYIDNIRLYEADATITNPDDSLRFVFNPSQVSKTVSLNGNYVDVTNKKFSNSITLQPYTSAVLIKDGGTATSTGNTAPTVSITSPVVNASYTGPATINMSASASDADGTVSKVEFYNGTTLIHTEKYAPYTYSWANVPAGTYTLAAKATDNNGLVTTSAGIKVSVTSSTGNRAPVVNITSPSNYASYKGPATINMSATASDVDGSISKVEFYKGTTLLHTEYTSPYTLSWKNVPAGTYTLTAKATDNKGLSMTSSSVKISVTASRPSNNNQSSGVANNVDTANLIETLVNTKADLKGVDFRLYPNPATNIINVNLDGFQSQKRAILTIQNIAGSILKRYQVVISGKSFQVDISSLNTGTFIISLSGEDFNISKKFIKAN